jgi:hypothetical protein
MESKFFIFISIFITTFSCIEVTVKESNIKHTGDSIGDGLVVFFVGYTQRNLKLSINDTIVFDGIVFPDSGVFYTDLMIQTNIRNSNYYRFNINHSESENNFILPAQGLDSISIGEVGLFNIQYVEKKYPNKNKNFTFYLSKNIANNCNVKIAADSDTIYNGKFLNNYPRRYYNSMKLTHTFSKKRFIEIYVEIFDDFTYFSIDTEKFDAVKVDFKNQLLITTNLDEEWSRNHVN